MIAFLLAQTIAITGGTVYPVSGPKIEHATVLIRDGRIVAVGANVTVPADATKIDATGKWVTPGLIDGAGQMGLTEISAVPGDNEASLRGSDIAASFNVAEGINPASNLIPVTRVEGVTTTLAAPGGAWIQGQAVLIDLDGATIEQMLIKSEVGIAVDMSEGGKGAGGNSRAGVAGRLRRVFNDALEYSRRKAEYSRAQMQQLAAPAAELEALLPVLRGQLPLIVEPMDNIPSYDALGTRYENAALLAKAGVKVSLLEVDTHNSRRIRQQAGNAVSFGMTWDQALRAVTLTPAETFGVADRNGSLDAGKVANVVVWSGDPFEIATGAEHVFIRGHEVPLTSR